MTLKLGREKEREREKGRVSGRLYVIKEVPVVREVKEWRTLVAPNSSTQQTQSMYVYGNEMHSMAVWAIKIIFSFHFRPSKLINKNKMVDPGKKMGKTISPFHGA